MMLSAFRLFALLSFISAGYPLVKAYNILVIGGTRFSGAALWKELHERGHQVTLFNRGKTTPTQLTRESPSAFESRLAKATFLKGDRKNADDLRSLIDPSLYDYVYDMNAREEADVIPLAELFIGVPRLKQYVFMSSAGVYLKSNEMPHLEKDPVDPKSRHSGKLDSERFLDLIGIPFCSFRPTYICGPQVRAS
jgi:nucleoside-diphosphate-sugar epimerase